MAGKQSDQDSFFFWLVFIGNNSVYNNKSKDGSEHESISIKNRVPIKSIRIERDYTLGDGITRFYTEYPKDLEGRVSRKRLWEMRTHVFV